jgi:fumarate reductase flavoprotein subunit
VDTGMLQATLAECAGYAQGLPDPLGRARFSHVLAPPYRASWVTGTLSHTQGGAVTDAAARVLDAAGNVITGLYAAGGSAAGLSGTRGDGYLPGNGLAQSFGLAWLAVHDMCG